MVRSIADKAAQTALFRSVYVWMTLALVITGFTAYGVATSPGIMSAIIASKGIMWGLLIAEIALVFYVTARINRLSLTTATVLFILYSVLNGATLSIIFLAYTMQSIASVFFITAGTFAVMAVVGYTTKKDLTSMGKMLFMALIGLIIATVVNMFLGSTGLQMIISYVGVLIFVGLTAYDSQKIKQMLIDAEDTGETAQKLGFKTFDDLKQEVWQQTFAAHMRQIQREGKHRLMEEQLSRLDFPLPESLVQRFYREHLRDAEHYLKKQHADAETIRETLEHMHDEAMEFARKKAKGHTFLLALAQREGISVSGKEAEDHA